MGKISISYMAPLVSSVIKVGLIYNSLPFYAKITRQVEQCDTV